MQWNSATQKYEGAIALNNPHGFRSGITYANGKLIADDQANRSTPFIVETGFAGNRLSGDISLTYETPSFIPVIGITGTPTAATAGTPLTLTGAVNPSNSTSNAITWSVKSAGTTGATVNGNILNTTAAGTATITATIANGNTATTPYTQDFNITVTSAATAIYNTGDIAVVNSIIDNNNLALPKASANESSVPGDWTTCVIWSNDATNKRVTALDLFSRNLTGTLNLSGLARLETLVCFDNNITGLGLSGLGNLKTLFAYENQITSLNLSGLANLTMVECADNKLTALNVSGLAKLETLYCYNNQLTSLNLAGLGNLRDLNCGANKLASLDLAGLTSLERLNCYTNQLTTLNVAGLSKLNILSCTGNHLAQLNLAGLPASLTFYGAEQTLTLALALNQTTQKYEAAVALNNPVNLANGISYSGGKLIANNNSAASTPFKVQTGLNGKSLEGIIGLSYTTSSFIPVTSVTGVPAAITARIPLVLAAAVTPSNATNKTIAWSIKSTGTTGATISGNTLNTTAAGTAVITATIVNGASPTTNYSADFSIKVNVNTGVESASSSGLQAVAYNGSLLVSGLNIGDYLYIYNLSGMLVYKAKATSADVIIDLERGLYIIESGRQTVKAAVR
jgi:endo-1,4-beta-xylanase